MKWLEVRVLAVVVDAEISRHLNENRAALGESEVRQVSGMLEALAVLRQHAFDVLVLQCAGAASDRATVAAIREFCSRGTPNAGLAVIVILPQKAARTRHSQILDAGADIVIPAPVHMDELGAVLRALQRRLSDRAERVTLTVGPLQVTPAVGKASLGGHEVQLPKLELAILVALMQSPQRTATAQHLAQSTGVGEASIGLHVRNLRSMLGESAILSAEGGSYQLGFG